MSPPPHFSHQLLLMAYLVGKKTESRNLEFRHQVGVCSPFHSKHVAHHP